jgi:hypothetical protein
MADQEKKALNLENLEVTELDDASLEDVAGGTTVNISCPVTNNCPLPQPQVSK